MSTTDTDTDFYYCEVCNEQFGIHSLHVCFHGHFFCKSCYKQEYYKGKETRCPHLTCNAWIDHTQVLKSHGEPARMSNKMFPQPALYSQNNNVPSDTDITNSFINNSSLTSTSKKPLRCPFKNCNRSIAVTSLDSHFQYEHKHVGFVDTIFNVRNILRFPYEDVKLNEIVCLAVIKILDSEELPRVVESNSDSFKSTSVPPRPSLVVMASKVALFPNNNNRQDSGFPAVENIFVWVGSNVTTRFCYTLALTAECCLKRLKYSGPLLTINEDHEKLCSEGKGLILSQHQVTGLTENCTKGLGLEVLIDGAEEPTSIKKSCR